MNARTSTMAEDPAEFGQLFISDTTAAVAEILNGYARRGFLRRVSVASVQANRVTFCVVWHFGRPFLFALDFKAKTVAFLKLLPLASTDPRLQEELNNFLRPFASDKAPEHRRVDQSKGRLTIRRDAGALTIGIRVQQLDYEYCTRRLVHLVQEVFVMFLRDGPYYDYMIENLGLDPESAGG